MSKFRMFIEYITIMFISYLVINLFIFLINDNVSYKQCLNDFYNFYLLICVYWWIPIFRMIDIDEQIIENF